MNFNSPNFLITFLKIFFIFFVRFWRYEIRDFVKIESNKKRRAREDVAGTEPSQIILNLEF